MKIFDESSTPTTRYRRLVDQGPSAKFVYFVLASERSLTKQELRRRTLLPDRTLRYAISQLDEADILEKRVNLDNPREYRYSVRPVEPPEDG